MTDSALERRIRVVVAAFGDHERGRIWRERLGAAHYRAATESLMDALTLGLGRDFEDLDGQGVTIANIDQFGFAFMALRLRNRTASGKPTSLW